MEFLNGKFGRKEKDQKCATLMPSGSLSCILKRRQKNKNAQNMKKRTQKYESVKMQNSENLKAQKLKSWLSPVSPGDDSGELVAAHEWTWQVGFNKNNPQFKKTHFPFFCLYLTTQFRQICLQG